MALDDFLVNSDYPMDIVVFAAEAEVTSFSGGYGTATVNHGLPFIPLPFGVWSTDGGTTWQPITGSNAAPNEPFTLIYADETMVGVTVELNSAGTPVKVRMYGLQPAGLQADTTPPNYQVSDFNLNSDYNYSKLVASTVWSTKTTTGEVIVQHSLGYIPEVIAWAENTSGRIYPLISLYDPTGTGVALTANTSTVQAVSPGGAGAIARVHVRVYGGANG